MRTIHALASVLVLAITSCGSEGGPADVAREVGGNLANTMGVPRLARVTEVAPQDAHWVAQVATDRFQQKLVFDPSPGCQAVLQSKEQIEFRNVGTFGRISSAGQTCDAVGTLSLEAWYAQRNAPPPPGLAPRATSYYREAGGNETLSFLRGRFPGVGIIGIPGGTDIIVAIPRTPTCEPLLNMTVTSMEFRRSGAPLVLIVKDREACACAGVFQPRPGS